MNLSKKDLSKVIIFIFLLFVIFLGFSLRIWGINKEYGMWGDELFRYIWAKASLFKILTTKEWTPPLYYSLLHYWIKLFGKEDIVLRGLSVLVQTICIPVMYLAGKEFHSRKTGLLAAFFISINSLSIYYAQEVGPYALITLLSSLIILMVIKTYKEPSNRNFLFLGLSNIGLLYTHSPSFIFVFFEYLFFGIFLYFKNKSLIKRFLSQVFFVLLIYFPCFYYFIYKISGTINMTWGKTTLIDLGFSLSDLFSPMLINRYGSTQGFYSFLIFKTSLLTKSISLFFIFVPVIIAFTGIYFSIKQKNKPLLILLLSSLCFILVVGYESLFGKIVLCTRYIIEVSPILILAAAYGLRKIKTPNARNLLILNFAAINLFYLTSFPSSAPKLERIQGFTPAIKMLKELKIKNTDEVLIYWFDRDYFQKYYDFEKTKVFAINKDTYYNYVSASNNLKTSKEYDLYDKLKPFLASKQNEYPSKIFKQKFVDSIPENSRLIIVVYDTFIYEDKQGKFINKILKNNKLYKINNIYDLTYIKLNSILLNLCDKNMKFIKKEKKGCFTVYVYQKPLN